MEKTNKSDSNDPQRKLSIQVSLNGLSFCSYDSESDEIINFEELLISDKLNTYEITESLTVFFKKNPAWKANFKSVQVFHSNSYFTWVPTPLFNPENCGSYLQFSSKVFDTDWFTYDVFDKIDATFVYIPLTHLNNILLDFYASFDYYHSSYQWLKKIYDTKDNQTLECCILIEKKFIEIAVLDGLKLILHNQFAIKNATDVLYYVLFCYEQLGLNPDEISVFLMGQIEKNDDVWNLLYEYIREVQLHPLQSKYIQKQIPFSLAL